MTISVRHYRALLQFVVAGFAIALCPYTRAQQDLLPQIGETTSASENGADPVPQSVATAYSSPYETMKTFLEAMNEQPPNVDRAATCLDTSAIAVEAANDHALKLQKAFNRIERVPLDKDRFIFEASNPEGNHWTYFPDHVGIMGIGYRPNFEHWKQLQTIEELADGYTIDLVRQADDRWLFSSETVAGIEEFWNQIEDLETVEGLDDNAFLTAADHLEQLWPAYFRDNSLLGIEYWQWLSLFALIFLGILLDFTLRLILSVVSRRVIRKHQGEARTETLRKTVRPFGLAAAGIFWLLTLSLLGLPSDALKILVPAARLFAMLAGVWAAYRLTDLVGEVFISKAERTETKFDDLLIPLVRKAIKVFITVFGLIYIADSFHVPIAPLLTGLGIGGAGFAFAAKDTLEHFFGSITVIADRPFQVGDWVEIGDTEGIVEEVGFRSTRVRTFYNSLVTIPNGNLVRAVVDNYGKRKYRRWTTHLNVTYDTPPERIDAFCEGIRELIRVHPYTRKDYYQVWLHKFGAHSLDILVYVFHETPDWQTELRERHRLILDILRLADRLGVQFAFPTQTLHVFKEDAEQEHTPAETPEEHAEVRSLRDGRQAAHDLTATAAWRRVKPGAYRFRNASGIEDADDETQIEDRTAGDAG